MPISARFAILSEQSIRPPPQFVMDRSKELKHSFQFEILFIFSLLLIIYFFCHLIGTNCYKILLHIFIPKTKLKFSSFWLGFWLAWQGPTFHTETEIDRHCVYKDISYVIFGTKILPINVILNLFIVTVSLLNNFPFNKFVKNVFFVKNGRQSRHLTDIFSTGKFNQVVML